MEKANNQMKNANPSKFLVKFYNLVRQLLATLESYCTTIKYFEGRKHSFCCKYRRKVEQFEKCKFHHGQN